MGAATNPDDDEVIEKLPKGLVKETKKLVDASKLGSSGFSDQTLPSALVRKRPNLGYNAEAATNQHRYLSDLVKF